MTDKILCIYHGNCADGFGAAWVVREFYGEDKVEFFAGHYGKNSPDVVGRTVVMVDFAYSKEVIVAMAAVAKSILIIDHHKTAEQNLVGLPENVTAVFDMSKSGALLTWHHFFSFDDSPPALIEYISDRDLWKFEKVMSKEVSMGLFSYPYDFDVWHEFMCDDNSIDQLKSEGTAILRKHFKDLAELLPICINTIAIGGINVRAANIPYTFASDAAGELAIGCPFGASYFFNNEFEVVFSLRSTKGIGEDVAMIAEAYGGGGHRHASGFKVSFDEFCIMRDSSGNSN